MPGWALSTAAAAVVLLLAVGGLISWSGLVGGANSGSSDGDSSATALPVAVARMTAVFRPGDLTDAEWDDFSSLVGRYDSAIGYLPVDQTTAHQQAVALFADDANALAVLNNYPDIASAYAQVDFAKTEDAYAFQEAAGSADYIVAIMGANGPRLARGYATSPELPISDDDARGAFWAYAYQSNLPATIEIAASTTTTAPWSPDTDLKGDTPGAPHAAWTAELVQMGATPVADEDLINAGIHPAELESGSVMSGTAYRLATATQSSPVTAETGVLTYVGLTIDETGDRNTVAYCVTHYATVGATTTGGGGMCMTTIESALERLHFGLSVEGSYAPTEVHQAVVWGVPSETRVVDFHLDDGTTYPIPVTQGRTAHLVWTDDRTVESVKFKGMTEHHDEVLSELLPNQ